MMRRAAFGLALVTTVGAGARAPAGELRGRVVASGRPVVATVSVVASESPLEAARREALGAEPRPPLATASTRADGVFVLDVPQGALPVSLRIEAAGFVTVRTAASFEAHEAADIGEVRLFETAVLSGRAKGARGQPVAGAVVWLEPGRPAFSDDDLRPEVLSARCGPDGAFRIAGASAAGNRLRVEAEKHASAGLAGLRAGSLGQAIVLSPAQPLAGQVLGSDGKTPVAGVLVHVLAGTARSRFTVTDAEGRFRVGDASARAERVVAEDGTRGRGEIALRERAAGPLSLVLARPAVLEGRIVDAASGAPVARARVLAHGASGTEGTRSLQDGRYRIEGLAPGRYRVSADEARRVPYARDEVEVTAGRTVTVDLPLRLAATLSGRVVDEEGRPVAGATGRLRAAGTSRFELRRSLVGEGGPLFRTAADGTFRASRVPPGQNQQLAVSHPEYEARTVAGLDLPKGGGKSGLTIVMRAGLEVSGRVVDVEGRPLAGAEVTSLPSLSERAGRGGMFLIEGPGRRGGDDPPVLSDADGSFRVGGLAPGVYALSARLDGYADAAVDPVRVEREEPSPEVEMRLLPGATIRGAVRRSDGSGAKGQIVRARPESGGEAPRASGPLGLGPLEATGEDGAFAIDGLRAGETYTLQVLGPPGPQSAPQKTGVRAPTDDALILLPGVGRIEGRVVDARTREPLTEFTATYEPEVPQGMQMRLLRAPARLARRLGGDESEGTFRSPEGRFILEDVPAGVFSVVVEARGYESARVGSVTVREGEATSDVEVRATRGRAIRGRVLDAVAGRAVVGATVSAVEADSPRPPLPPGLEDAAAFTDADGGFELVGLGLGTWKLVVRHSEYSEASRLVELQDPLAEVEIRLSSGGSLAGVVVSEGGAPVGGASVQLSEGASGGAMGGGGFRFGPGGMGAPQTLSDDSGQFRFERLSAGRYGVTASLRGRSSMPVDVPLQVGERRADLRVSLEAGATVRGRIVGLDPTDLATANVSASGPQSYFAGVRPAADGSFVLGGVPRGAIDLQAMAGDFASGMRSAGTQVVIEEGQAEVEAEIAFEAQGVISGRVTRGGEAVGDVMVSVSGGTAAAFARTDAGGAYRLEGLQDGSYTVTASPSGGAPQRGTVEVRGEATLDFDLPLARLAGAVVEAGSGLPLASAEVEVDTGGGAGATMGAGRGRPRVSTDSTGRFALEGLTPGPATLTARRTGYVYERRSVEVREEGGPDLTVELQRGEGLGLRARDGAFGVPLHSLFAQARDAAGASVFAGPLALDSDGRGEVPSLRPGSYSLTLSAAGYAPLFLRATVPSPTLEVALTAGGTLEIRSGPETQARAPRARLTDGTGSPVQGPPVGPDGFLTLTGAVRRLEHLAPGGYTLAVEGGPAKAVTVSEGGTEVVELP